LVRLAGDRHGLVGNMNIITGLKGWIYGIYMAIKDLFRGEK
jgi:hypothetical protein